MGTKKNIRKGNEVKIAISLNYFIDKQLQIRARFNSKKNKIKIEKVKKEKVFFTFLDSKDEIFILNKNSLHNNINSIIVLNNR